MFLTTALVVLLDLMQVIVLFRVARDMRMGRRNPLRRSWAVFSRVGRHHSWAIVLSVLVSLVVSVPLTCLRYPIPRVHDEFSHLLLGDTLAHGRLANPTHPLWVHFETMHVLQKPTYASKYPPGQGAVLALGQVLTGHPIAGVWLATALAVGVCCWMLQGWVPGRWALLGSLLVAFHFKIQVTWGQNYWGGQVAMIGGALVFGALPRIMRRPRVSTALLIGLGAAILANSRPYEGLLLCLVPAATLIIQFLSGKRVPRKMVLGKVMLPASAVLVVCLSQIAYYNKKVTLDPLTLPYQLHTRMYEATPLFLWQEPGPVPRYRHPVLRDFYAGVTSEYYWKQRRLVHFTEHKSKSAFEMWFFFLWPLLTAPLVMLPYALTRKRLLWIAVGSLGMLFAGAICVPWMHPHYLAPGLPVVLLLIVEGLRYLRTWRIGNPSGGRAMLGGFMLLYLFYFVFVTVWYTWADKPGDSWERVRAGYVSRLSDTMGKHLVIVRYAPNHSVHDEWVYNAADIDDAPVVWARDMGAARNRRLLDYFHDRQVWLLEADEEPPLLRPYERGDERHVPDG
jgi:hypothetical protein